MASCNQPHGWPNIDKSMWENKERAECCTDQQGLNRRALDRTPCGVEDVTGRITAYNSTPAATDFQGGVRNKAGPCNKVAQQKKKGKASTVCKDVVLPNPSTRESFAPWNGGPRKPCIRKRSVFGVYVGYQPMPETAPLDPEKVKPWDDDTWIPAGGIFLQYPED